MKRSLITLLLIISSSLSLAGNSGQIQGYWQLIDNNGQPKYIIRLYQQGNKIYGRLIQSVQNQTARCSKCKDENKDKPYRGLTIIKNLQQNGDNRWSDGKILNPETGKWSKVQITMKTNGTAIIINSYGWLGSWFGDKDTWTRRN